MFKKLLPARGGVGPATFNVIADCADTAGEELGTPEDYADRQDLGGDIPRGAGRRRKMAGQLVHQGGSLLRPPSRASRGPLATAGWAKALHRGYRGSACQPR